jgi:hypothetical protein
MSLVFCDYSFKQLNALLQNYKQQTIIFNRVYISSEILLQCYILSFVVKLYK